MPKVRVESRFILSVLFFLVISLVLFRAALNPDVVFSASDANMGWLTFKKGAMPLLSQRKSSEDNSMTFTSAWLNPSAGPRKYMVPPTIPTQGR